MSEVVCFGEVLWDVLPHGRFLGGAPLNVAYHLAHLGYTPRLVSAFGNDPLGDEGALLRCGKKTFRASAPAVAVRDTIGAGDAFTAALVTGILRAGAQPDWMAILACANAIGAFVASRDGAQPAYRVDEGLDSPA